MSALPTKATCRGCERELNGSPYYTGKPAFIPETGEPAKKHFYGGWICSDRCDRQVTSDMNRSIDNHNDPSGFYRAKATRQSPWD